MQSDPLQPHSHDNNVVIPGEDPTLDLFHGDGRLGSYTLADLAALPQQSLTYRYTTDHGPHGPYELSGVALGELISAELATTLSEIEVISADGFGNRIYANELRDSSGPILLCTHSDGAPLSRQHGLIRLVVPSETDNALRQIKWVKTIRLITSTSAPN